jgi:hypothetical protein
MKCHVSAARLVLRSRHPRRPGLHIREFGLVGFQDRLAVEPDRDPAAGALDLDRVPLGCRPRRVGGRALVPIILRFSLDAPASVLSRAMSGQPGPMPKGAIPVYPLCRVRGDPSEAFSRVTLDHGVPAVPASSGPSSREWNGREWNGGRSLIAGKCIPLPTRWGRVPRTRGGWGAARSQSHVRGVTSAVIAHDSIIAVMASHPHPACVQATLPHGWAPGWGGELDLRSRLVALEGKDEKRRRSWRRSGPASRPSSPRVRRWPGWRPSPRRCRADTRGGARKHRPPRCCP